MPTLGHIWVLEHRHSAKVCIACRGHKLVGACAVRGELGWCFELKTTAGSGLHSNTRTTGLADVDGNQVCEVLEQ